MKICLVQQTTTYEKREEGLIVWNEQFLWEITFLSSSTSIFKVSKEQEERAQCSKEHPSISN